RDGLVSLLAWTLVLVSGIRLHLDIVRALGLAALSLWVLELHSRLRVVVVPRQFLHVVARPGELVSGAGMDWLGASGPQRSRSESGYVSCRSGLRHCGQHQHIRQRSAGESQGEDGG